MSAHFKAVDRETLYLFPPSIEDWLPKKHLARFIVDVVSKLDLHELKMPYSGVGSEAFNPEMLLALLFYGYATGVFSSRKLEQATHDSIAFRYIAANTHPDHDTIATFRKRFLPAAQAAVSADPAIGQDAGFSQDGQDQPGREQDPSQRLQTQCPQLGPRPGIGTTVETGSGPADGDG